MYFDKKPCRGSHSATIIEKYNLYINQVAVHYATMMSKVAVHYTTMMSKVAVHYTTMVSHGVLGSAVHQDGVQGGAG